MVWVIMDRLTKFVHFILVHEKFSISKLAQLFIDQIVQLHGVPVTITSGQDAQFTSKI